MDSNHGHLCRKRPLCQLSLNHCPFRLELFYKKIVWKSSGMFYIFTENTLQRGDFMAGLQFDYIGFDQRRKYFAICM